MKKTLLSVLAGLAVIGSASAEMTVEQIRGACQKHPEKYVWVEKDQFCAPINPCKSDNSTIQRAYCNYLFRDVQLSNWREGINVVKHYVERQLGVQINDVRDIRKALDTSMFGQDYIPVKTSDGGYIVFEFDDLSDIAGGDKYDGAVRSACIIYGGNFKLGEYYGLGKNSYFCLETGKNNCSEISELAAEILYNDVLFVGEYVDNARSSSRPDIYGRIDDSIYNGCKIVRED